MNNNISRCKPLLGTYVEVNIKGDYSRDDLVEMSTKAFNIVEEIENTMSFYDKSSELSYINNNAYDKPCDLSKDMLKVISTALNISQLTNGLYDISIVNELIKQKLLPKISNGFDSNSSWKNITIYDGKISFSKRMKIDLGGIAKGYAVDKAFSYFKDKKDVDVVINAGGDLIMNNWKSKKIDIKYNNIDSLSLKMYNKALATSSNYYFRKGQSAIISPFTREPKLTSDTISVFADNCMLADALTKVIFLDSNIQNVAKFLGVTYAIIGNEGNIKCLGKCANDN